MESLPLRPFDPANFFLQQCWQPPTSLLDSTNLPKLFGFPFPIVPPSISSLTQDNNNDSNNQKDDKKVKEKKSNLKEVDKNEDKGKKMFVYILKVNFKPQIPICRLRLQVQNSFRPALHSLHLNSCYQVPLHLTHQIS